MKKPGIRVRILIAAILPAVLVAAALAAILLDRQYQSLDAALQARALAYARQLGSAAEFDIFAGNREALQALARATQSGDPDIVAVSIRDIHGSELAASGTTTFKTRPDVPWEESIFENGDVSVVASPIRGPSLPLDDVYSGAGERSPRSAANAYVIIEMSRQRLNAERDRQLLIGIGIALGGAVLAAWLALGIAGGVIRAILNIRDVVDRIGKGELEARVSPDSAGVMPSLEIGINGMAERIETAQEFLIQQIDRATAELRERKEEAERANAAKSRFVAAASHDLRQPLHALGLFVSRLSQLKHGPEVQPLVEHIDASVQALQDLLDTLLDMSRLDAGLVDAKPSDIAIADLFRRVALEHGGPAEEKGVVLRIRPSRLRLHTDAPLLARVLNNLVSNALRYTPHGGVLVACRRRGDKAMLQVWDTGIGIPSEHLDAVFHEYTQLGNPERNKAKGLGLGLAICDRIAKLLGSSIGVRSIPGRGSVFWVTVPLGRGEAYEPDEAPATVPSGQIEGVVVVVEDDVRNSASMADLIAGWGCLVVGASSAAEAIELCGKAARKPDMIIADFRLPGDEDGMAAALALHRRFDSVPVVLIGGDIDERLNADAARRHFTLLTKPVRPGKLRAIVQQTLAQNQETADSE